MAASANERNANGEQKRERTIPPRADYGKY